MPPRIPSSSPALLLSCADVSSSSTLLPQTVALAAAAAASLRRTTTPCLLQQRQPQQQQSSPFSTTAPREKITRQRKQFFQWLRTQGKGLRDPAGSPNYVESTNPAFKDFTGKSRKSRPFPLNPEFMSESVLSDSARELIWKEVMEEGQPIKAVSARHSVDMRRVAAVLRMKAIEKSWRAEGKPLAIPYAKAVLKMVPTNHLRGDPLEPINDIHVHSYTTQQVFYPTSESREFTRDDAAKAFGEHILPVDKKMRIPELLGLEKDLASGVDRQTAEDNFIQLVTQSESAIARREAARLARLEASKTRVDSGRFEFRFEDMNVDSSGKDGRSRRGVGWKYGAPYNDRKRGVIKIPTKVE